MGLTQTAISHFKQGLPFLKPLWPLIVAFGITGVLIYKLPISDEARAKSKFLHPELIHEGHGKH